MDGAWHSASHATRRVATSSLPLGADFMPSTVTSGVLCLAFRGATARWACLCTFAGIFTWQPDVFRSITRASGTEAAHTGLDLNCISTYGGRAPLPWHLSHQRPTTESASGKLNARGHDNGVAAARPYEFDVWRGANRTQARNNFLFFSVLLRQFDHF